MGAVSRLKGIGSRLVDTQSGKSCEAGAVGLGWSHPRKNAAPALQGQRNQNPALGVTAVIRDANRNGSHDGASSRVRWLLRENKAGALAD